MNYRTTRKILISLFVTFSFAGSVPARTVYQTLQTANPSSSSAKHIASIRTESTANGSRVTITSTEPLTDYGAYRNGDNFMLLIPSADLALTEINTKGAGFTDAKVEGKGTNLAFSFRMDPGVSPSVRQVQNRIEITFTLPSSANLGAGAELPNNVDKSEGRNGNADGTPVVAKRVNPSISQVNNSPAAAVAAPVSAPQGTPTTGSAGDNTSQREVDLSVPESPAFTVLGVNPENVTRPTTPRAFATSLLNGVDLRGNFQSGLALDFVPYLTFFGGQTSLFDYRKSRMERFLARTQLSFATTKGATDADKSNRLALGLRMTLWDQGDPRLDTELDRCYTDALNDPRLTGPGTIPGEAAEQRRVRLQKRKEILAEDVKSCNDTARKRNWNASGWIVGLAPSWINKTGETNHFVWNGGGFWTSLAYGFNSVNALKDNAQLIFHARYRNNESVPDPNNKGKFFIEDSLFLGGRLRIAPGDEAKSILSFEGNFIRSRLNKGNFDNSSRYSLGFEQRLAENIWFSLSAGGQSGRSDSNNHAFVLSSFKWGFAPKK